MTRQELYDEIKKTSKDAFILDEMKRLGFWDSSKPQIAKELIEKKVQLQKELNQLSKKIKNPEQAVKEIYKKRMQDALIRRQETKQKALDKEQKAIELRKIKKDNEIGFIGHSFIDNLKNQSYNQSLLEKNNLFI